MKINPNPEFYKYYKIGDIIVGNENTCWRKVRFIIRSFQGNHYTPMVGTLQLGKPDMNRYVCNFDINDIRLVGADSRPFRNLDKKTLIGLMNKGVIEAKREFMMRINCKTL